MPELLEELQIYMCRYMCDNCGGELKYSGIELTSNPPQYPHNCPKCGKGYTFIDKYYPRKIYKKKGDK